MHQASYLLPMLLAMLAGRGLAPETLDPWRAWVVFKQFVRVVDEVPDPGVSVQLTRTTRRTVTLSFVRQVVEQGDDDWLVPVGGLVVQCEFDNWKPGDDEPEFWSFDFGSFDRFVDLVEQNPAIADRLTQKASRSRVSWEDA